MYWPLPICFVLLNGIFGAIGYHCPSVGLIIATLGTAFIFGKMKRSWDGRAEEGFMISLFFVIVLGGPGAWIGTFLGM